MLLENKVYYYVFITTNTEHSKFHIDTAINIKDRLCKISDTHMGLLLYWESFKSAEQAISREYQLRSFSRKKLLKLIKEKNATFEILDPHKINIEMVNLV